MTPQELKNSILQLAIQGRLVEQRPEEGTAEELYKRIQAEKQSLIKAGKLKKEKPLPPITDDEKPFEIPESWMWVRIGNVFNLQAGKNITSSDIYDTYSPEHQFLCYGGNGIRGYVNKYNRNGHYAIIGRQGALCGNINYAFGEFYATEHAVVVEQFDNTDVIWCGYFLKALNLNQYATATAQPGLAVAKVNTVLFPLPPLAEQKRIVAKIEELMPLIDRYEKAWSRLEDFNKRFPDDMQKSILQMAIQGKLVEQRPEEGTGEELYKQIQSEKKNLAKKGEVYRDKEINSIKDNELPFDIPDSWIWCRLGALTKAITKGSSPAWQGISYTDKEQGILFVTSENVGNNEMLLENKKYIEKQFNEMHSSSILKKGDILTNLVGASIGRTAIFNEDIPNANINQAVCIIRLVNKDLNDYVLKYFNSYIAISLILKDTVDTARANLSLTSVTNLLIPLPPLAEQKRIVEEIEELLPLCDRLKYFD